MKRLIKIIKFLRNNKMIVQTIISYLEEGAKTTEVDVEMKNLYSFVELDKGDGKGFRTISMLMEEDKAIDFLRGQVSSKDNPYQYKDFRLKLVTSIETRFKITV